MLIDCLKLLIKGENLTFDQSTDALEEILLVKNPEQIAAFLALMRAKGETATELTAFVRVMQRHQIYIDAGVPLLDIVGTGGDGANTANISTIASILAASCGVPILKHGNRAASSQAGCADVLEALGLNLQQTPQQVIDSVKKHQIGFCFAPLYHPALLMLRPLRQQLKIATFFNLLGPLLNPGQAQYHLLGVFDPKLQLLMADILLQLGATRAMVVHGNGLDELNCLGACEVIEINGNIHKRYSIHPEEVGLPLCQLSDLLGGDAQYNAMQIQHIVENEPSALANTAIFNAAAAVYLYGKTESISAGVNIVRNAIKSGAAKHTLKEFIHA